MFSTQSLVKMLYRSKLRTELCGCPPEIFFQVWAALMGLSKLQIFLNWTSIQLSKFIIKFKKQSWTRWSQHLGSVKGNHPQKQKLRFWMEKLGSSCFHPNWGTWPPGLLPVSGDPGWGLPRITVSPITQRRPWGVADNTSWVRIGVVWYWRSPVGEYHLCGAPALTPRTALSERHQGYEKPWAPGFYHLQEQPVTERVI